MFFITLSETIRVFLIFIFMFFIVPLIFIRKANNTTPLLDRFFHSFVYNILFQITVVHILVFIKLYDVISISIVIVITLIILIKYDRNREMGISRFVTKLHLLYDTMDTDKHRKEFFQNLKKSIKNVFHQISEWFRRLRKTPIFALLMLLVFLLSAAVRLWHSLIHYAYPHLDMYLHLKWIKAIISNNLYLDNKIYPKAMHSVIAFISKITFSDPYWVLRYFGPMCGVLLVVSIYFLAFKVTGNKYLSLLAMAIYGMTVNNDVLPSQVFRQTATMPQEFGMLFIILGFTFLIDYIRTFSKRNLFSFEACLLIGLMSHSFSGAFLIFWTGIVIFFSLVYRKIKFKSAIYFVGVSAMVSVVSFVPLVLGRLLGKVFHESSLEMVTDITGIKISELLYHDYFQSLMAPDSLLMLILVFGCIGLMIVSIFIRRRYQITDFNIYLSLLTSTIIIYFAYNISSLIDAKKLPELLGESRIGPFLSLLLPIAVSILIFYFIDILFFAFKNLNVIKVYKIRRFVSCCIIVMFIVISIVTGSYSQNTFYKHVEYDQAAEAFIRIKSDFTKNPEDTRNWYVVSTDPQFAQVIGYGWYEEGYNFTHDYTKEQVADPNFQFEFPVNHIFIFVEKKPILYDQMITVEYGEKELEPLGDDPFMQFYQDGNNRAIMEGHIWMLAEAYAESHSNVSIYYEDDDFKIYRIYQEVVDNPQ